MPGLRQWKLLYAAASVSWVIYVIHSILSVPVAQRSSAVSAFVYCVLLVGVLPAAGGYVLLFKAFPWLWRLRRSQRTT